MPHRKKHYTTDQLRPRPRDLFGQVPVSVPELEDWVRAIAPNYAHAQWRMRRYIHDYNVADKVRAAKLAGTFYGTVANIPAPFDRCSSCSGNS